MTAVPNAVLAELGSDTEALLDAMASDGARFTIATDDRTLRYTVGIALALIAAIYAAGRADSIADGVVRAAADGRTAG